MVGEGKGETKRAQRLMHFMSDELFPCIESRYHVTRHRVGIGHSLGSSLLMYALCVRDSLFNTYMMFSPNLVYGQDRLLKSFKTKVPVKPDKFVYISKGETGDLEAGYRKGVRRFDSLLVTDIYCITAYNKPSLSILAVPGAMSRIIVSENKKLCCITTPYFGHSLTL